MTMPIIFLDIDGVLNSGHWRDIRGVVPDMAPLFGIHELDPQACNHLQQLCDQTEAQLVIASTWRNYLTMREIGDLFKVRGLTAPIIGQTPDLSRNHGISKDDLRGLEVQWWLQNHFKTNEEVCGARFVCLDDEHFYGDLRGKLVQTRPAYGLTFLELPYIRNHLHESLMDSHAAGGSGRVFFEKDVCNLYSALPGRSGYSHGPAYS